MEPPPASDGGGGGAWPEHPSEDVLDAGREALEKCGGRMDMIYEAMRGAHSSRAGEEEG
jgi:hypothetical protein